MPTLRAYIMVSVCCVRVLGGRRGWHRSVQETESFLYRVHFAAALLAEVAWAWHPAFVSR